MVVFLVIVLLVVVLMFGVSSIMQSHAAAKQAESVIETAQAAQVASVTSMISTVVVLVMAVFVVLLAVGFVIYLVRFMQNNPKREIDAAQRKSIYTLVRNAVPPNVRVSLPSGIDLEDTAEWTDQDVAMLEELLSAYFKEAQ